MRKSLFLTFLLVSAPIQAAEIKPWLALADMFKSVPDRVMKLVEANPSEQSDFERVSNTLTFADGGLALVSGSREIDTRECFAEECYGDGLMKMRQNRGGLSWNLPVSNDFTIATKAEVVHYERLVVGQRGKQEELGLGVGLDSKWQITDSVSAYLNAGVLQNSLVEGVEGMIGLSRKVRDSRYFVEATWLDMDSLSRNGVNTDANQLRVGIAHAFSKF